MKKREKTLNIPYSENCLENTKFPFSFHKQIEIFAITQFCSLQPQPPLLFFLLKEETKTFNFCLKKPFLIL